MVAKTKLVSTCFYQNPTVLDY